MRLTVNLDDDLYALSKSIAKNEGLSISAVVNRLLRKSQKPAPIASSSGQTRNGFPIVRGAQVVTPALVEEIEQRCS